MVDFSHLLNRNSEEDSYLRIFSEKEIEDFYKIFVGDISEKPETEQELFSLQKKYLMTRDLKYWNEMLLICYSYFRSCLLKTVRGGNFIDPDNITDASIHAAFSFMKQYIRNKDFIVGASFAGMATWKIFEGKKMIKDHQNNELSLNFIIDQDSGKELEQLLSDTSSQYQDDINDSEDLVEIFERVMNELREVENLDSRTFFLVKLYVLLNIRGPKNRHSIPMFLNTWANDYVTRSICEETLLEINKRMREELA